MDQQVHVRAHEMLVNGDLGAVRQDHAGLVAELLDEAENVVPTPAIQAGRVLAKLPEDFVHFEGGQNRLDQHGRPDGASRNPEIVLRRQKYVVPQAGFQMAFQFRQIEIRAGAV